MLIIGCGYIGRRLGARYAAAGRRVTGIVKSRESAALLKEADIKAVVLDLDSRDAVLPLNGEQRIFYLAPPPSNSQGDPRLKRVLDQLKGKGEGRRIVYASTTGVYGDCQGDWVDEKRKPKAGTDRAKRRLDAERQLLRWRDLGCGEVVILRVAGIYGPGRLPLAHLRQGRPILRPDEAPLGNRVHADDLVTVCEAAMERGKDGRVYNVSDGKPGTMTDYYETVARLAGLPAPRLVGPAEARDLLPAGLLSFLTESRRLDNTRMLKELGVALKYPSMEDGVRASLKG